MVRLVLPTFNQPRNSDDWFDAARERGADATAMFTGGRYLGAVYMAGYAVECALKGYSLFLGRTPPTRGGAGHDLRALWKSCDLQLRDLRDDTGSRAFFVEDWSTDLRYAFGELEKDIADDLVTAAQRLTQYVLRLARRRPTRRRT
jgi:HEPN domain-containing protein